MKEDLEKIIKYKMYLESEKIRLAKIEIRELKATLSMYQYDEEKQALMEEYREILLDENVTPEEKSIAYGNMLQLIKQINNIEMEEKIKEQISREGKKICSSKLQMKGLSKQLDNFRNNSKARTRNKTYYRK